MKVLRPFIGARQYADELVAVGTAWQALGIARYDLGLLVEAVPALEQYVRMARKAPVEPATRAGR